ncbi:MAG: hypothetical protein M0P13_06320 [Fibrobacteraceae bacterium]|nr:hypothetical protein [Fibrobacteraceae bacterium]
MAVQKLKLTKCKNKGRAEDKGFAPFAVLLNPENYTITSKIAYNNKESGQELKFNSDSLDVIKFSALTFDSTGAIPDSGRLNVKKRIDQLKKVICAYDGSEHETPVVKLEWGSLIRYARLSDMNVQYVLFSEDGTPLRATVDLSFIEAELEKEILAKKNKSSPDMTHLVEVKAGDSLPLMCSQIYNDASYYLEVARVNGLSNFRQLKAGSYLYFPPLSL